MGVQPLLSEFKVHYVVLLDRKVVLTYNNNDFFFLKVITQRGKYLFNEYISTT